MKNIKKLIKKMVEEIINEMTGTGAVAGYETPGAFSKGAGKNNATKYTEKLGFKVVGESSKNRASSKEVQLKEAVQYDASKDMNAFRQQKSAEENKISQNFSAALKQKLLSKNVELHGSKGYGQFKSNYSLRVFDVSVADWYGKDDYQLIITGDDKKQYFVDTAVPIKILDPQEVPTKSKPAPTTNPPKGQPAANPQQPAPTPAPKPPATPLDNAISK